jgi:replicative DNA helicase
MKMQSKYIDIPSIMQVLGNIFKNPELLAQDDKYHFIEQDFPSDFQKICFGAIYNIFQLGGKAITLEAINDYLSSRPKLLAEYKVNKGDEFLLSAAENANPQTMGYYYSRLKKMTLLRGYESIGVDLSWLYDPDNIFDTKKKEEQEQKLDNMSLQAIADLIGDKIEDIKNQYVDEIDANTSSVGDGIFDMLKEYEETPDIGIPMFGPYMNTVTRGARLTKFYLRSAATNVGKTRTMVGDAFYIGCSRMYDNKTQKWVSIGKCEPTLLISTEQEKKEIQCMGLAFISGVNESHIETQDYLPGEKERVAEAAKIISESKILFSCLTDFSMNDFEQLIKKEIREHQVSYVFLDYIHTSMGILEEITKKSGGVRLREDQVLFMMSVKLKTIAMEYGVFILSATQLNGDWKDADIPDQNLLRGSKAIADKVDIGMILLEVTKEDIEKIGQFCKSNGIEIPNVKMSIYKNRANEYKGVYLWMNADKGTCRFETAFLTDWRYNVLKDVPDMKISVVDESAF